MPGKAKTGFSLESGINSDIFGCCNISWLLNSKNHRFGPRFGGQVGHQNRTCWLQEGRLVDKKGVVKKVKKLKV